MSLYVPTASLKVEHIADSLSEVSGDAYTPPTALPLSKPASPQITWTSGLLEEHSISCVVRLFAMISAADWPAIQIYAEVVVDGVSKGTKTLCVGARIDYEHWGDFDPLVTHQIEVYLWASGTQTDPAGSSFRPYLRIGTVSDVTKTVWLKRFTKSMVMVFSSAGIVDTTHLFTDNTQVTDYNLWWSGASVVLKGTNFNIDGNLLYQKILVD